MSNLSNILKDLDDKSEIYHQPRNKQQNLSQSKQSSQFDSSYSLSQSQPFFPAELNNRISSIKQSQITEQDNKTNRHKQGAKQIPKSRPPQNPDQLDKHIEQLQKELVYLKQQKSHDEIINFYDKEVIKKKIQLEFQVDQELEELDKLLLMQSEISNKYTILQPTPQKQHLSNLYKIINGQFEDKLFLGLGLPEINKQDSEIEQRKNILNNLKQLNINTMVVPLQNPRQNQVPATFIPPPQFKVDQSQIIISYRYDIQIKRHQIVNLRKFELDADMIEFFLCFLEEFSNHTSTEQSRKSIQMRIGQISSKLYGDLYRLHSFKYLGNKKGIDFKYENQYLQKFDKIIIPIQAGFHKEFQLVILNVSEFKLVHYHLCETPNNQPTNQRQQLEKQWQFDDNNLIENVNLNESRRKQQDQLIQLILLWIQCTARHFSLQNLGDMKQWKIRLENNLQVKSAKQSGLYLLLICSLLHFKQSLNEDKLAYMLNKMQQIVEHVVCSLGVGLKQLNPQVIQFFEGEMQNMIKFIN